MSMLIRGDGTLIHKMWMKVMFPFIPFPSFGGKLMVFKLITQLQGNYVIGQKFCTSYAI